MNSRTSLRWLVFGALALAIILVPFLLFADQVEVWIAEFMSSAVSRKAATASVLCGLLASDILLPIPSSIVSTSAGYLLGSITGTLVSLLGMTISCVLGYGLGALCGRPAAARLVGATELERLEKLYDRFGHWVVVVFRPVPVLAEASVLFAGVSRMSAGRFLLLSTLSNLGISVVYAALGELSATAGQFLLAFGASIIIPGLAMLLARRTERTTRSG